MIAPWRRMGLKSLVAMLATATVLLAVLAPASAAPAPSVPEPGTSSVLNGDWCTSASNCWAVGRYDTVSGARLNEVLRWPGTEWSLVPVPQPGGTGNGDTNQLAGVTCTAASNCWAAGSYNIASLAILTEALHWNGSTWSLVSTPQPGGTGSSGFSVPSGVSCLGSADCWAAGGFDNLSGAFLNEALHWNGSTWSLVATPQPDGTSANDQQGLSSVTCTTSADCWAAGHFGHNTPVLNEALHWNGSAWLLIPTPDPGGSGPADNNLLFAVRCGSSTSCWAVGWVSTGGGPSLNQALHWNGSTWSPG